MDALTLAGQVLVVGYGEGDPPPLLVDALEAGAVGGVVLFRRNIPSLSSVHAQLSSLPCHSQRPPMVAVDQEGGRVERLKSPVMELPPMRALGRIDDEDLTRRLAHALGTQLRAIGFNTDFAPVLDVDTNPANPIIGDRAFGASPESVIKHAAAFATGLADASIISCGKHFPGHGDTELDSHLALPTLKHPRDRLDAVELAPFRAVDVPTLMTAHVVFESLDANVPATMSRRVIGGLLREELGYKGVVISDDLEMKAVADRWGIEEAALLAIEAGCDVVLVCSDTEAAFRARRALADRADKDGAFASRLSDAAERFVALRREHRAEGAADLDALRPASLEALSRELNERLSSLG